MRVLLGMRAWSATSGDCLDLLKQLPDCSVDSVVTDPPYGLSKEPDIVEVMSHWVSGDRYDHGSRAKGEKYCASNLLDGAIIRDSDRLDAKEREKFISFCISVDSRFVSPSRVKFDDDLAFGKVEVDDHRSPVVKRECVLVQKRDAESGETFCHGQFRFRKRERFTGCVGTCACLTHASQSSFGVVVGFSDDPLRKTKRPSCVVASSAAEDRAVLSFNLSRGTGELRLAQSAAEFRLFPNLVASEEVGAGSGTRGLTSVTESVSSSRVPFLADGARSFYVLLRRDKLSVFLHCPRVPQRGFMGKSWDSFVPGPEYWREAFRVLKPGSHALIFAGTRTVDLMMVALRFAGFEIRDEILWIHSKGFPKSVTEKSARKNFGDRAEILRGKGTALKPAHEPIILARKPLVGTVVANVEKYGTGLLDIDGCRIATEEKLERVLGKTTESGSGWKSVNRSLVAGQDGGRWPANLTMEHSEWCQPVGEISLPGDNRAQTCKWMKAGKPCQGHGNEVFGKTFHSGTRPGGFVGTGSANGSSKPNGQLHGDQVRLLWDCIPGCAVAQLDAQGGFFSSGPRPKNTSGSTQNTYGKWKHRSSSVIGDKGYASRYFYCSKPAKRERNLGCEDFTMKSGGEATDRKDGSAGLNNPRAGAGRTGGSFNPHPTLKSIALMRWLVRLITPAGGVVLDPFAGSFTTIVAARLEGMRGIGFELDPAFVAIGKARVRRWELEA